MSSAGHEAVSWILLRLLLFGHLLLERCWSWGMLERRSLTHLPPTEHILSQSNL